MTWLNWTLATTGKRLLDAGNVIFKATFLLRKIVALVAILWFTGWLQETICFVLHYLLLTIRMIPFHQSSTGEILYTCCGSTLELGHGGIFSSYFTHICSLGQPVSQFEFWLVGEFVLGGQYSI